MITWGESKRRQVLKDHGVDIAKIEDILDDPFAFDYEDSEHSHTENRRVIVGKTAVYGLVVMVYVVRGENTHCITARRAERWMMRIYEKQRKRY